MQKIKIFIFNFIVLICFVSSGWSQSSLDLIFGFDEGHYQKVEIIEVLQTDLVRLEGGELVKLIGLKGLVPLKKKKEIKGVEQRNTVVEVRGPLVPIEEEANEFVKDLLEGQFVRLEFDEQKKDDSHHTLAYVFLAEDGRLVNEIILENGMAYLQISPPNIKYVNELRAAYQKARRDFIGIHNQ